MRRASRQLLRSAACATRRREAPAAAWCRALATSQPAAGHKPALEPRGTRATTSSAPAGWAASVLEAAAGRLQGEDDDAESDSESDDESEHANAGASPRRAAPFSDDDSSDDEEEEAGTAAAALPTPLAAPGARGVQSSRLAWPPPPGALDDNPELASMVRPLAACRALHTPLLASR
jgi:hypothetical protein